MSGPLTFESPVFRDMQRLLGSAAMTNQEAERAILCMLGVVVFGIVICLLYDKWIGK